MDVVNGNGIVDVVDDNSDNDKSSCRICLGEIESEEYSIFQELDCDSATNIDGFLMSISDIKISSNDDFPHSLCPQCYNSILFAFDLRLKCNNSQSFFNDINLPVENLNGSAEIDSDYEKEDTTNASFITPLVNDPNIIREIDFSGKCIEQWDKIVNRPNISCNTCGKVFHKKSNFKAHYETHLPDFYKCHVCERTFKTRAHFINHLKAHQVIVKAFNCELCDKKFQTKVGLRLHGVKHSGQNYDCKICNKKLGTPNGLTKHNKIYHSAIKPFLCTECGKSFPLKASLTNHTRVFHSKKQFLCSECGKAFSLPSSLRAHKFSHTVEKKYSCNICQKSFKRSTTLRTHIQIHGEKRFKCDDCGKQFIRGSSLRMHQKICASRNESSDKAEESYGEDV